MAMLKIHPSMIQGGETKATTPEQSKEKVQRTDFDIQYGSLFGMTAEKRNDKVHRIDLQAYENDSNPASQGFNPCRARVFDDPKMPAAFEHAYGLQADVWDEFRQQTLKRLNQCSYIVWAYLVVSEAVLCGIHFGIEEGRDKMYIQYPSNLLALVGLFFAIRIHNVMKKKAINQISMNTLGKAGLNAEWIWVLRSRALRRQYGFMQPQWLEIYPTDGATASKAQTQKAAVKEPEPMHTSEETRPLIGVIGDAPSERKPGGLGGILNCCSLRRSASNT